MRPASLSLVVPVFNEEERLSHNGPQLADFMASFGSASELIIVDDGSTDGTCEVAERLIAEHAAGDRLRLLRRPHRGKGASVQSGLEAATTELAGFCDVDLATPLDQFERLCGVATSAPALVIGSRGIVSADLVQRQSGFRESLGRSYNRLLRLSLIPGIYDTQCGAKVAAGSVWCEILPHCREEGFAWDVEVVAVARRRSIHVREVGVRWSHDARTRVRPVRDGLAMIWAIPRIWRTVRSIPSTSFSDAEGRDAILSPKPAPSGSSSPGQPTP